MSTEFHRLRRLPPCMFASVNDAKASARSAGADIIGLGIGHPDGATPLPIAAKAAAPGIGFGAQGTGHGRIALVEHTRRLRQAVRSIKGLLAMGRTDGAVEQVVG